jgi:acyl-CoA reductase-like NAD-dependent aldehyde dehydrogenase
MVERHSETLPHEAQSNGQQNGTSRIQSINPATGALLGEVSATQSSEAEAIIARARSAQRGWAARSLKERLMVMRRLRSSLYHHYDELVDLMVKEQGKTTQDAMAELLPTLELVNFYLRNSQEILAPERVFALLVPHRRHVIERRPYGVVLVISPWNFPVLLPLTPVIAALVAGNTVVLKPSEYTVLTSGLIDKIIKEAGVPDDVFQLVYGYGDVGAALLDARPDKLCFTGSERVGRKVAARAGELLIPVTLELGGKDAAIVLEDANIKRAARGIVWGGTLNAGQACISIERVYVVRSVADDLLAEMKRVLDNQVRVGPGTDSRSTYGAITNHTQMNVIQSQLENAAAHGAQLITGKPAPEGLFCTPTVVTGIDEQVTVASEETFGPVITVMSVENEQEAIERTNNSRYGLTTSIWTENRERGRRLARQVQSGVSGLNEHIWSQSTPEMPWGGVKASGYGRTRGREGLLDMTYAHATSYERFRLPFEPFWVPYLSYKRSLLKRFIHLWYGPTLRDKLKALKWRVE